MSLMVAEDAADVVVAGCDDHVDEDGWLVASYPASLLEGNSVPLEILGHH